MRLLQRDFEVETRYGGNFVQEIDGLAGGREGGRRVDWFYYVNGIESGVGAGRAQGPARRPDLVGPPRLERHDARPGRGRLLPRAVRVRQRGPQAPGPDRLPDRRRRRSRATRWRRAWPTPASPTPRARCSSSPPGARCCACSSARGRRSGATPPPASSSPARPSRACSRGRRGTGDRIDLLDEHGRVDRALGAGGGLLAATRIEAQQPTWIVTGVDATGVSAAAAALTEEELQDHFAIAVEQGRTGAAAR